MWIFFRKGRFAMLFPEPWKEVASNSSLCHVDHLAREKPKNIWRWRGARGGGGHITLWLSFWTIWMSFCNSLRKFISSFPLSSYMILFINPKRKKKKRSGNTFWSLKKCWSAPQFSFTANQNILIKIIYCT